MVSSKAMWMADHHLGVGLYRKITNKIMLFHYLNNNVCLIKANVNSQILTPFCLNTYGNMMRNNKQSKATYSV